MLIDGSWVLAMREKASEDIKSVVKVAMPPFPIICGGPSNNLSIPKDISKEKKDIVWKFIELASTLKWQEEYAMFTGNPSPKQGSVTDRVLSKSPDLEIFAKAMNRASESYLPAGFESQFSEFSKFIVKVNYSKIVFSIIGFITVLTFYFDGFIGLIILLTATAIGLVTSFWNIGKNHLMGCLILPVILYFIL